jgi:hypothetical protein
MTRPRLSISDADRREGPKVDRGTSVMPAAVSGAHRGRGCYKEHGRPRKEADSRPCPGPAPPRCCFRGQAEPACEW